MFEPLWGEIAWALSRCEHVREYWPQGGQTITWKSTKSRSTEFTLQSACNPRSFFSNILRARHEHQVIGLNVIHTRLPGQPRQHSADLYLKMTHAGAMHVRTRMDSVDGS